MAVTPWKHRRNCCMRSGVRPLNGPVGFLRGGNWNNGGNAGVETLNLNNAPGNTNSNIGFRCARYTKSPQYAEIYSRPDAYGCLWHPCVRAVFAYWPYTALHGVHAGEYAPIPSMTRLWNCSLCTCHTQGTRVLILIALLFYPA